MKFVYYNPIHPAEDERREAQPRIQICNPEYAGDAAAMKNLQDVLLEKETELLRVREEVQALQLVAPMLLDGSDNSTQELTHPEAHSRNRWPLAIEEPRESSTG